MYVCMYVCMHACMYVDAKVHKQIKSGGATDHNSGARNFFDAMPLTHPQLTHCLALGILTHHDMHECD